MPVEFASREELENAPVTDMEGYGTYPMPADAWSDDTSMSLAALDSLATGKVDWDEIMQNFGRCSARMPTPPQESDGTCYVNSISLCTDTTVYIPKV